MLAGVAGVAGVPGQTERGVTELASPRGGFEYLCVFASDRAASWLTRRGVVDRSGAAGYDRRDAGGGDPRGHV